jgi:hypothetical protein
MVRPVASDTNKAIALAFAASVTKITQDAEDIVARCGRCGIFSALRDVFPQTVRDHCLGVRDGVSEMEFNKLLQVLKQYARLFPFTAHL